MAYCGIATGSDASEFGQQRELPLHRVRVVPGGWEANDEVVDGEGVERPSAEDRQRGPERFAGPNSLECAGALVRIHGYR